MYPVRPWHAGKISLGTRQKPRFMRRTADVPVPRETFRVQGGAVSISADILAFIVGLTLSFNIVLIGELPIAEMIMLLTLPLLLIVHATRLNRHGIAAIYALMALWLVNQVVADLYRKTAFVDWTRGQATIIFFAIDLAFMAILLGRNQRRKLGFVVGFAVGSLLAARYAPTDHALDDPWKFGYATGVNLLAVLVASWLAGLRRYLPCALVLIGIIGINIAQNFRSPVLLLLIAAALTLPFIPERIGRLRLLPRTGTVSRVAVLALLAVAGAGSAIVLVRFATASGIVGEDAQAKNNLQLQGGFLFAGRPEIIVSSRAMLEHPIIGWGSWAKDFKYVEMLSDFETQYDLQTDLTDIEEDLDGLIPSHSHLMGAWVWAGAFGALFWFYILLLAVRALLKVSVLKPPLALFYAYLLITFLWDIFFSPFQAFRRTTEAFLLVVIIDTLNRQDFRIRLLSLLSGPDWTRLPAAERQAMMNRDRKAHLGNASDL